MLIWLSSCSLVGKYKKFEDHIASICEVEALSGSMFLSKANFCLHLVERQLAVCIPTATNGETGM
jgi:hypothetical protein